MKKIIFALMITGLSLFAQMTNQYPTKELLKKNIPIVDIRTKGEWKETGILQGAIPITFWDAKGHYDAHKFLNKLNKKVDTTKPFALICHTGSRTSVVAPWLSKKFGYKVINLQGGMEYVINALHIKTVSYKK